MSLFLLASGILVTDPQRHERAKGPFATARLHVEQGLVVSTITFGPNADVLLSYDKGSSVAISGRAKATEWRAADGTLRRGLSVTAEQIIGLRDEVRTPPGAALPLAHPAISGSRCPTTGSTTCMRRRRSRDRGRGLSGC